MNFISLNVRNVGFISKMQRILNLVEIPECEDNENKKGSSFVEIEHLGHFNCQTGDILVRLYRPARFVSIDKVPTKSTFILKYIIFKHSVPSQFSVS